jgi:hypothetical protein
MNVELAHLAEHTGILPPAALFSADEGDPGPVTGCTDLRPDNRSDSRPDRACGRLGTHLSAALRASAAVSVAHGE